MKCKVRKVSVFLFCLMASSLWAIKLPDGTNAMIGKFSKYESGGFKKVELLEPTEIKTSTGTLVFKGDLYFYENGQIEKGELDKAFNLSTDFGTFSILKVSFYQSGALMSFYCGSKGAGTKIKTKLGDAVLGYSVSEKDNITLYESGALRSFYAEKVSIDEKNVAPIFLGIPIEGTMVFYEDGTIASVNVQVYNRKLRHKLNTPYGVFDMTYYGEGYFYELAFYKSGKVRHIKSDSDYIVKSIIDTKNLGKIKVNLYVEFWENENLKHAKLSDEQTFEVKDELFSFSEISCYETGEIKEADWGRLAFWKNGNLRSGEVKYSDEEVEKILKCIPRDFFDYFEFFVRNNCFDESGKKITGVKIVCKVKHGYTETPLYFLLGENFKFLGLADFDSETLSLTPSKEKLEEILKKLKGNKD